MPARPKIRHLAARDVFIPPGVVCDRAGLEFVGEEAIRPAADHFLDLLGDRGAGDAFGLDENIPRSQREQHRAEWLLEDDPEALVVDCFDLVCDRCNRLSDWILLRPTLDRRDGVARQYRDVVVEDQVIAQRDRLSQFVRRDLGLLGGLRLGGKMVVEREQGVPDHVPVHVGNRREAPQRVDGCEGDRRDEPQRPCGTLGERRAGEDSGQRGGRKSNGGGEQISAAHGGSPGCSD